MMFLKRIHLKNYRRYQDEDIEFPTGLIGIVGRNGSGKSSLIEAVGWCLYGNSASRTKKDQIKTTGIPESENCSVTLEMMLGSDTVKIVRELKGKNASGHASIFVNGNANAEVRGMNEVSEFIAKRTGMDHVAFFTSVFAKQKELDSLSNLQPGERKKTIVRLLRINKIDDAISTIRSDVRVSMDKISFLQSNLKDIDSLEKQSSEISEEKEKTSKQIQEHDSKIKTLLTEEKRRKTEFAIHEKKYRNYNKASKDLAKTVEQKNSKIEEKETIVSDLKTANKSKKRMNQIAPKVKEYETIKKQKEKLDSSYGKFKEKQGLEEQYSAISPKIRKQETVNKKIEKSLVKLKGLDQELKKQDKEQEKQEANKEGVNKSISVISTRIKDNRARKSELEEEFYTIKELGKDGECPTCKRPLIDHLTHVSKYFSKEISKLTDKINADYEKKKKLDLELESIKKKIAGLDENIEKLRNMKTERTSLQTQLKGGKKAIATMNRDKTNLAKKLKKFSGLKYNRKHHLTISKQHNELSKIKDESMKLVADVKRIPILSSRQKQSNDIISKLDKREKTETKRLDSIGYSESEYKKSEENLEDVKENHRKTREKWIELNGESTNLTLQIKQIVEDIKEEKEKRITIDKEKEKIGSRSKLEKIMNEFRLDLISRIRPILSQRASELFRKITKGKYPSMELDKDYNVRIEDEGSSFTTERFSGGEEDLANLCLRIAISQELAERAGGMQANFIALDEIFGSQDKGRKNNILEAFSELSNQFKQILIITHVEDVKEILPYVLTVKENSYNTVKIETEGIGSVATA